MNHFLNRFIKDNSMISKMEWKKNEFIISTDKEKLDIHYIYHFLTRSYWAKGISFDKIKSSIEHSLCFGVYKQSDQIGYARVISDFATFGYLCDVFIDEGYRKKGLGKWLTDIIFDIPEFNTFRRWVLATRDAHALYQRLGFCPLSQPEYYMEKYQPDIYCRFHPVGFLSL